MDAQCAGRCAGLADHVYIENARPPAQSRQQMARAAGALVRRTGQEDRDFQMQLARHSVPFTRS